MGELKLLISDNQPKFYQSFYQDISNLSEEEEEAFFNYEEKLRQKTEKIENDNPTKKIKIKLNPHQLRELKKKEIKGKKIKQKEIAEITGYSDRMVRY